jgi:hypothetical protein
MTDGNGRNAALVARLDTAAARSSFGTAGKVIQQLGTGADPASERLRLVLDSTEDADRGVATVTDSQFDSAVFLARLNADGRAGFDLR